MKTNPLHYFPYNEHAILITWPNKINETVLNDVLTFKNKLLTLFNDEIQTIKSAYNSLLVEYHFEIKDFSKTILDLKRSYNNEEYNLERKRVLWKIPVCYNRCFGVDIAHIENTNMLSHSELIHLHTKPIYTVYFIGFLPGFLYLGGLDKKLFCDRHALPRQKIKKGAVAIGGKQTGIYPQESPGGWQIIGNSPLSFFNSLKQPPCFINAGDKIQFYSVSLKNYNQIKSNLEAGVYNFQKQRYNG